VCGLCVCGVCVCVCTIVSDLRTSKMRWPMPDLCYCAKENIIPILQFGIN